MRRPPSAAAREGHTRFADSRIARFLAREHALGSIVYVCSVPAQAGNALLALLLLAVSLVWSALDGVVAVAGRSSWGAAATEGVVLYIGAIGIANLARALLGQVSLGW